ncbi:MAG: histidine kinase [Roseivirga sp.]|nr:histidine kinase [Roseivirga sp.]
MQFFKSKSLVFLAVPPVLATLLNLIYVISSNFAEPSIFSIPFLLRSIIVFYFYLWVTSRVYNRLERKSADRKLTLAQHGLAFVIAFLISLTVSLATYSALKQFYISFLHQNDRINIYHLSLTSLSTLAGFILIYSVYISNRYYSRSLSLELKEEQLQRERLEMKYELLNNKMNPHFLFNNLNTLHSLIAEDSPAAEDFLVSLSKIMRYSFKTHDHDRVSLNEELEVLEDYALIMKNRFDDAMQLSVKNEAGDEAAVLPMSLMNLMENAVKHNEVSSEKPLNIDISIDQTDIIFTNNLNPKTVHDSSGSGLKHLKEIYTQKYHREVLVEKTNMEFRVSIPVIEQ